MAGSITTTFTFFSARELKERAFNLSLAALLGNEVYNFGELVRNAYSDDSIKL